MEDIQYCITNVLEVKGGYDISEAALYKCTVKDEVCIGRNFHFKTEKGWISRSKCIVPKFPTLGTGSRDTVWLISEETATSLCSLYLGGKVYENLSAEEFNYRQVQYLKVKSADYEPTSGWGFTIKND